MSKHTDLKNDWETNARWNGIRRDYAPQDVERLRGNVRVEYSLARQGAEKLWRGMQEEPFVNALGALTGNQAMQQVKAGLKAIYLSGWQVAADANLAGQMYPDQSLYPADSVPGVVRRINNALMRADQLHHAEGDDSVDWMAPIVADAEAGFGGVLNAHELMKAMIDAGAAGVHFEDQLASAKKCGHMGGKVLVPTSEAVAKLSAARLAADIMGVPTILVARTDAMAAGLVTSDVDEYDHPFISGERTVEGFFETRSGMGQAIARGLAYAPYADLLWCETGKPDLEPAQRRTFYWETGVLPAVARPVNGTLGSLSACQKSITWGQLPRRCPPVSSDEIRVGPVSLDRLYPTGSYDTSGIRHQQASRRNSPLLRSIYSPALSWCPRGGSSRNRFSCKCMAA